MAGYGALTVDAFEFPDPDYDPPAETDGEAVAILAGGCFWCTEAVYKEVDGVLSVRSGYAGGTRETAEYRTVCSGMTDHAEAIEIRFDPKRASFGLLLKLFFSIAHDPTQLNFQGNDVGRQYRSAIFYADERQKAVAEAYLKQIEAAGVFKYPVVTTLEPLETFYEAEDYHQDYAAQNPMQPYILGVSRPKVEALHKNFADKLKSSA